MAQGNAQAWCPEFNLQTLRKDGRRELTPQSYTLTPPMCHECVYIHILEKKKMKTFFKRQQNQRYPLYQTVT